MPAISQYESGKDYSSVQPDIYFATITHCAVVMDPKDERVPLTDQYGKNRVLVKVTLDDEVGPDGGPIELRRQLAISYGKNNTTGQHAALALLIAAACGIAAGNAAQKHVTTEELVGKRVRVRTDNVEKNGTTYTNIVDFLPPARQRPAAAPVAKPPIVDDLALGDEEIPF